MFKHVIVCGGGIAGLTAAASAKRLGMAVTVLERQSDVLRANAGSGLGLWPTSLLALDTIDAVVLLEAEGQYMPSASYRDSLGRPLGQPSPTFHEKYPVLCIHRDRLQRILYDRCTDARESAPVEIRQGVGFERYEIGSDGVTVHLTDGSSVSGDVVIGADGIHSRVRSQLLRENGSKQVSPVSCGYTYFRATLPVSDAGYHSTSFESWGSGLRFGYVPLRAPETFWFASIPNDLRRLEGESEEEMVQRLGGSHAKCTDDRTKQWLLSLFDQWTGPLSDEGNEIFNIGELIEHTPSSDILATEIHKVPGVQTFDWSSNDGRVLLIGDSAHATAPNLAQGAGLSIEDAVSLTHVLDRCNRDPTLDVRRLIDEYELTRKNRAQTVQDMADLVAQVGQLRSNTAGFLRDCFMRCSLGFLSGIHQWIFERAVSHSLGGGVQRVTWEPPSVHRSILESVLGKAAFARLPDTMKKFRSNPNGGSGSGLVTVERGSSIFNSMLCSLLDLPSRMAFCPFTASVEPLGAMQKWTRTFGVGTQVEKEYWTTHSTRVISSRNRLTEGIGGALDRYVRFAYDVQIQDDGIVKYESHSILVGGITLPLPSFLLPKSQWTEEGTTDGWTFDGELRVPLFGRLMRYYGNFSVNQSVSLVPTKDRVIVIGGSGLLGTSVCRQLQEQGYEVVILSRSPQTVTACGARVCEWDTRTGEGWSHLIDNQTVIINVSGENPGCSRWTDPVKERILSSRLQSIGAIKDAIQRASAAPRAVLQASAVGIYGHAGGRKLTENSLPSSETTTPGTSFRKSCIKEIESALEDIGAPTVALRLGHLLSSQGGLLPHFERGSTFGASGFGNGSQYVPWVHIDDAASAISHLVSQPSIIEGIINISSPNPVTNKAFMKALAATRGRSYCCIGVPSSMLTAAVGESACVILDSERVVPERLQKMGFNFRYPTIDAALSSAACTF